MDGGGAEPQAAAPGADGHRAAPDLPLSLVHLAVLSTFALAQPLFDLLSDNPEFFAARGSTAAEIVVFALALVALPPLLLGAVELLVGLAGPVARRGAHLVLMALLAGIVFIQALKGLGGADWLLIAVAALLGAGAAALYARAAAVRSFVTVLSPVPAVFIAIFLLLSPVSKITLSGEASAQPIGGIRPIPVVMVVFDELPVISLLDDRNRVDPVRYPGFARLERDGIWFRNGYTIYDATAKAVPAIMDGHYPEKGLLPISADHPNSLFTLLGASHSMNVSEAATTVCPRDLCDDVRFDEPFLDRLGAMGEDVGLVYAHVVSPPGIEAGLPTVSETWGDFGGDGASGHRAELVAAVDEEEEAPTTPGEGKRDTLAALRSDRGADFDAWIDSIRPGRRPSLSFKHALLPHVPWKHLPSGQAYATADDPIPGLSRQSYPDETQVRQLQLRHLLQLGYADGKIERLIDHLEKVGVYERALVIVVADHGVAFRQVFNRRRGKPHTLEEIAAVPLFVKLPGQERGRIDDSLVETTDILPTIADVLDIRLPESTDGVSALSDAVERRTHVKTMARDFSGWMRMPRDEFERRKRARLERKLAIFGTGADGPERIFRVGPNQELLDRSVSSIGVAGRSDARVELTDPDAYDDVDPDGPMLPLWVTGHVSGADGRRDIAIAVDGVVRAVSNTFELATGRGGTLISALIPPSSLSEGRNDIDVYEVTPSGLAPMGGT